MGRLELGVEFDHQDDDSRDYISRSLVKSSASAVPSGLHTEENSAADLGMEAGAL